MPSYTDRYSFLKRQAGHQPDAPRFHRRYCAETPIGALDDRLASDPTRPSGITAPDWTVVVETDADTGIVRYVIDGERRHGDYPGPEQESNRALIEAAPGLLDACRAMLGYLRSPDEWTPETHATVTRYLEQQVRHAEGG